MPESTICICSGVRLDNKYLHTIYFETKADQEDYFNGKTVKRITDLTYLRKSWSLFIDAAMEQAKTWNYLYFKNSPTGKTYYYFINNMEYKNNGMIELKIELDVIQTYLFDFDMLDCFIDRQHTQTDAIGDNVVPENLETGELISWDSGDMSMGDMAIMIMSTIDLRYSLSDDDEPVKVLASCYNGVFGGVSIFATKVTNWEGVGIKLKQLDDLGMSDAVISIWIYPRKLINLDGGSWDEGAILQPVKSIEPFFEYIVRPERLNGDYLPKNNKLFTYPYNFLYATNNSGSAAVYHYERFGDPSECGFKVTGALSPEGIVRMYPLNYNGEPHAYEEGLNLGSFPTCAWNQDVYKLWLAQNQSQHNLTMGLGGLSIAAGVVSLATGAGAGVGMGLIASGSTAIASTLAQKADQKIQPPQARGQQSTGVNVVAGFQTFTLKRKSVTEANARIIDDYFTMYGYKINRVQRPNLHTRSGFTYIKTIGCKVNGNLCNEDITAIESIFDNGVTFWVNGDKIGDYSISNNCLEV